MHIEKRDLQNIKAFKLVMRKSKLEIEGESAVVVGSLFQWFNELEKRFENSLKPMTPKPMKDKIKEVD